MMGKAWQQGQAHEAEQSYLPSQTGGRERDLEIRQDYVVLNAYSATLPVYRRCPPPKVQ